MLNCMLFKLTNGVILMNKLQTLMKEYNKVNARAGTDKEQKGDLDTIKGFQAEILPATLNSIVESQTKSAQIISANAELIKQHYDSMEDNAAKEYSLAVNKLVAELDKLGLSPELVHDLICIPIAEALADNFS